MISRVGCICQRRVRRERAYGGHIFRLRDHTGRLIDGRGFSEAQLVPEPAFPALLGTALGELAMIRRRNA